MKRIAICGVAAAVLGMLSLVVPTTAPVHAQGPDKKVLAEKAKIILNDYCFKCHADTKVAGKFDVREHKTLLEKDRKGRTYLSTAGGDQAVKDSILLARIMDDGMPAEGDPLKKEEKKALEDWIKAGAPAWEAGGAKRVYVSNDLVTKAIYDDLKEAEEEDRPYLRYFVLNTLHNNPEISDAELSSYKAGLSKALNSMHWKKAMVRLLPLKAAHGAVFSFDLRDADWDRQVYPVHERANWDKRHYVVKGGYAYELADRWDTMMNYYPYGVRFDDVDDDKAAKMDRELYNLAGKKMVYMRADWYMARATRPPVYEQVLRYPNTVPELEKKLGVDVPKNFRRNRLIRAGYTASGVSRQHRLIERHDALYGGYWKSYDFLEKQKNPKEVQKSNLLEFPLGPESLLRAAYGPKYPYGDIAFKHDGGEMIFNLPNGLQGYFLSRGDDTYLDKGPTDVVYDRLVTVGTEIFNGLSCMACHSKGMIDNKADAVRLSTAVSGDARRKVRLLYGTEEKLQYYFDEDSKTFQEAAIKAMKPFINEKLLQDAFDQKSEPIGVHARKYYYPNMNLAKVAYELGYEDPKEFEAAIKGNREKMRELKMLPLINKGTITREDWDSIEGNSLYQRAMFELGRGRPVSRIK